MSPTSLALHKIHFLSSLIPISTGAVLSLCMVRLGSGRFGVGFWVGFWVGLRARDFPTERVLSRTPLIIRTVDQKQKVLIYLFDFNY